MSCVPPRRLSRRPTLGANPASSVSSLRSPQSCTLKGVVVVRYVEKRSARITSTL